MFPDWQKSPSVRPLHRAAANTSLALHALSAQVGHGIEVSAEANAAQIAGPTQRVCHVCQRQEARVRQLQHLQHIVKNARFASPLNISAVIAVHLSAMPCTVLWLRVLQRPQLKLHRGVLPRPSR